MRCDIIERAIELLRRQRCSGRADHLAAEAEAAIHCADVCELEQHPVGIAVHDRLDRAVRIVADRVGAFLRPSFKLGRIGDELPRHRIVRVGAVDQFRHGRRDGDCILRGDPFQRRRVSRRASGPASSRSDKWRVFSGRRSWRRPWMQNQFENPMALTILPQLADLALEVVAPFRQHF
jgi:hypothetical protein